MEQSTRRCSSVVWWGGMSKLKMRSAHYVAENMYAWYIESSTVMCWLDWAAFELHSEFRHEISIKVMRVVLCTMLELQNILMTQMGRKPHGTLYQKDFIAKWRQCQRRARSPTGLSYVSFGRGHTGGFKGGEAPADATRPHVARYMTAARAAPMCKSNLRNATRIAPHARMRELEARVSRVGGRTWLQLTGHGDMQGFDSSSLARTCIALACSLYIYLYI